jgi:hypothetical protein
VTPDGTGAAIAIVFRGATAAVRTGSSDGFVFFVAAVLAASAAVGSDFSPLGTTAAGAVTCGCGADTVAVPFGFSPFWYRVMYAQTPPPANTTASAATAAIPFVFPRGTSAGCREGSGPLPSASVIENVRTGCEIFLKLISPND